MATTRVMRIAVAAGAAVCLATAVHAQSDSNCCFAHAEGGCDDRACEEAVCACDPFCCDVQWDVFCATHGLGPDCLCSPAPSSCGALNTPECDFCWKCPACDEPLCPGDLTGSENVGVADLLELLGAWGACDDGCHGCLGDITCSGSVGVPDLLELLANWGECPVPVCGPAAGDCCTLNGTPGCDGQSCCAAVCAIEPACCEDGWTGACVLLAGEHCESCGCGSPDAGSCCASNLSIGCDNAECCEAVCACDPFCCQVQWDHFCATMGFDADCLCGPGQCGGSNQPECAYCFFDCDCITIGQAGCAENADCEVCVCGQDPFCCDVQWDGLCVWTATGVCADACCKDGSLPSCGPGNGDCFQANGSPGCDQPKCCEAICAADPFCCDVTWDQLCANQAMTSPDCIHVDSVCAEVAGIPGTNCCGPHVGVGCEDFKCCETICKVDAFCCDVSWDEVCAAAAKAEEACECTAVCGPDAGDCWVNNGSPGCELPSCCECVCAQDPFCCDVAWDSLCAGQALSDCAGSCGCLLEDGSTDPECL